MGQRDVEGFTQSLSHSATQGHSAPKRAPPLCRLLPRRLQQRLLERVDRRLTRVLGLIELKPTEGALGVAPLPLTLHLVAEPLTGVAVARRIAVVGVAPPLDRDHVVIIRARRVSIAV